MITVKGDFLGDDGFWKNLLKGLSNAIKGTSVVVKQQFTLTQTKAYYAAINLEREKPKAKWTKDQQAVFSEGMAAMHNLISGYGSLIPDGYPKEEHTFYVYIGGVEEEEQCL